MKRNFVKGDLLTLADNNEYCVVDKFVDRNITYVYLVDTKNNANILFGKLVDDRIVELDDPDELERVIKIIYNNLYNK